VLNFSGWGTTAIRQGVSASPYTQTPAFKRALASQADFVLIMFGTNDAREDTWDGKLFVKDLSAIIAAFRRQGAGAEAPPGPRPQIFLLTPPPLYKHRGNNNCLQRVVHDTLPCEILPFLAKELRLGLIDVLTPLGGAGLTSRHMMDELDGVHPNGYGCDAMARAVRDALVDFVRTGELPCQRPPKPGPEARVDDGSSSSPSAALAGKTNTQLWRVVGGIESDGVIVRQGPSLNSKALEERLSTRTEVVELEIRGSRLHYQKVRGEGPEEGWVSIGTSRGVPLLEPFRLGG